MRTSRAELWVSGSLAPPQRLRARPSPTPVRRSLLAEPRAQCEGRPGHGRLRRRRARRIREKGRTALDGGGVGGAERSNCDFTLACGIANNDRGAIKLQIFPDTFLSLTLRGPSADPMPGRLRTVHAVCKVRVCEDVAPECSGFSIDIGCAATGQAEKACSKCASKGGSRRGPRGEAVLQRPPSSRARTTSLHRADCRSSRQVRSLARECKCSAGCATGSPAESPTKVKKAQVQVVASASRQMRAYEELPNKKMLLSGPRTSHAPAGSSSGLKSRARACGAVLR